MMGAPYTMSSRSRVHTGCRTAGSRHAGTKILGRSSRHVTFVLVLLLSLLTPAPVGAWKPFTHIHTGDEAWSDATDDGRVTISSQTYAIRPEIVAALRQWPEHYRAGVIGPDGIPDLVYGQSEIHPTATGRWLLHIYTKAWEAQTSSEYTGDERGQILAFTYGYLTHAAGDVWAHTVVNDFAVGVFPSEDDISEDERAALIAIRHVILEGYVGDATPGFDGNRELRDRLSDGDLSDDSTPRIQFDVLHRFIYRTLIDLHAGTPSESGWPARGKAIDYFIDLEGKLQIERAKRRDGASWTDCLGDSYGCEPIAVTLSPIDTLRGPVEGVAVTHWTCTKGRVGFPWQVCIDDPTDTGIVDRAVAKYLGSWIDDIRLGLEHWSELGLAITRGLFDPQARRNAQNAACAERGSDDSPLRASCEQQIGIRDAVLREADPFILQYMISMLGFPDETSDVLEVLREVADFLDVLGIPFNPIRAGLDELKEVAKGIITDAIYDAFKVDVALVDSFLSHPTSWLEVDEEVELPGLGRVRIFSPGDHARIDEYMGLPAHHHVADRPPIHGFPGRSTRLSDAAQVTPVAFAPLGNTVTMAKLLLLDGQEVNRLLGDLLRDAGHIGKAAVVRAYVDGPRIPANMMIDGLHVESGIVGPDLPWLRSIDSDHAWRVDGQPRFCNADDEPRCSGPSPLSGPRRPTPRPAALNGGNGNFPVWESCELRPGFRALFRDWENLGLAFPDLGDACTPTSFISGSPSLPEPPAQVKDHRYYFETGFRVDDDQIYDLFERRGGVDTFGFPVSRTFQLLGCRVQIFQRQVVELCAGRRPSLLNTLDPGMFPYTRVNGSNFPAPDLDLKEATPQVGTPGYAQRILDFVRANAPDEWEGEPVNFGATFFGSVTPETDGTLQPGILGLLALELWGVPISRPARDPSNPAFVYQRFQRGIMHYARGEGTRGILLADYVKAILRDHDLPPDLREQARGSRYFAQYCPDQPDSLCRPEDLPGTDLVWAFEPG